jgi:nucleotide-binding universal stress UspA family protein
LLAGGRRIPTTVVPVDEGPAKRTMRRELLPALAGLGGSAEAESSEAQAAVEKVGERVESRHPDPESAPPVDVVTRRPGATVEAAVAEEARKGYDFLAVGLEPTFGRGDFTPRITRLAEEFKGPLAIILARGPHRDDPDCVGRDILVPVSGTEFSRRGAEFALALARASDASVTVLYASSRPRRRAWRHRLGRTAEAGNGNAILREIVRLGERQGVTVRPVRRRQVAAEDAILHAAESGRHDLIVMGVSQRSGGTLSFGEVPDAILDRSERSVVLVSS